MGQTINAGRSAAHGEPVHGGRRVFVNWGLGADSTAWLLHALDLLDGLNRGRITAAQMLAEAGLPGDCDPHRMVVVVAMTGTEWPETKQLTQEHVLPRLAAAGIRVVQVARAGPLPEHGITWLSDSHRPGCDPLVLHTGGDYRLIDEMMENSTIPTTGLDRRCSVHAKGWAADPAIAALAAGPDGRPEPYVQVMGFEDSLHERGRARRDAAHNTAVREGVYPLIELGWDRARCLAELRTRTGVAEWPKSACPMCPFGLATAAGRRRVLAGYARHPDAAVEVLLMEHGALATNERMGLMRGDRLYDLIAQAPGLEHVVAAFEAELEEVPWSLYEVRRALKGKTVLDAAGRATREMDPQRRGFTARRIRRMATGTRPQMRAALEAYAAKRGAAVDLSDARHPRVWLRRRGSCFPTVEQFAVAAPAVIRPKENQGFVNAWVACETYRPRRRPEQMFLPEVG